MSPGEERRADVRRNADAGDVDRGAARAEAEARDDDAAARRSEGARVWRRRHMAGVVVVVFSGRPSWRWEIGRAHV